MKRKKMKRLLALLLAFVLMLGCFGGCGESSSSSQSEEDVTAEDDAEETAEGITITYTAASMNDEAVESSIYVEPIEGISDDFIRGIDISTVLAEEASGVVYYNADGEEEDLFKILADAGYNYIRVRVWNDPYDSNGNGYGGGNCDVANAAEIGARAAQYGMKLLVDFHYSDFWADPSKYAAPKVWKHYTYANKVQAMYDFTLESLQTIAEAGADIGMVQIGNEINTGLAGETDAERICELLSQASAAVRAFDSSVKIAVHYTNVDDASNIYSKAAMLEEYNVDYDIFGVSYYAYWHGTMANLTEVLSTITAQYGKETCILETSYAYTLEEGDDFSNSVSETDLLDGYTASVQSQASCIRDICAAAVAAGSLGVFYWEGAWVPVGDTYDDNFELWETYGSGWASSYSAKYDPDDAGVYYGGCAWENQALFDFSGKALASLYVFQYLKAGTICEAAIDFLESSSVKCNVGEELVMPETVAAIFNNRDLSTDVAVTWDADQVAAIDTDIMANYVVDGVLEDGTEVTCEVVVAKLNYVSNESFEEKNVTMWSVSYEGDNPTDVQTKSSDAYTGENAFHFWRSDAFSFSIEQEVSGLSEGYYTLNAQIQGGNVGSSAEIYLYAIVNGEMICSELVTLNGWVNWQTPEITDIELSGSDTITIGMYVSSGAGGWGTIDDFYLYKQ